MCGWGGQLGYNKDSVYAANIYKAKKDELLSAVGFYATGTDTSYEIYVVPSYKNIKDFDDATMVGSGTKNKAGFYTVPLNAKLSVKKGQKFAIVIKVTTPGANRPLAVEYSKTPGKVDITDGESYISSDGKKWESTEKTQNCNVCLKAYTNNRN